MNRIGLKNILFLTIVLFSLSINSQNVVTPWSRVSTSNLGNKKGPDGLETTKALYFKLDHEILKKALKDSKIIETILQVPNTFGSFDEFKIKESSFLEPIFQQKHPELRTYIGENINEPGSRIHFCLTPQGFNGSIYSLNKNIQIIENQPSKSYYRVYDIENSEKFEDTFECLVKEYSLNYKVTNNSKFRITPNDRVLRTYRIAIASTVEFSSIQWNRAGLTSSDSEQDKKNAVLAAMVELMTQVNAIFQRDMAIKFEMVDNENIIFINSDNFSNSDLLSLTSESQEVITQIIGSNNFDIGHTFCTGQGGRAFLEGVCRDNLKARAATGSIFDTQGPRFVSLICHEIGHQFGANHTYNSNTEECITWRVPESAYEPGSGSTIMAYGGACYPQNVVYEDDLYFHQRSIEEMLNFIHYEDGNSCATITNLTNQAPIANAGSDYTIPISTPYRLIGSSTDPNGTDTHTYTWEQYDLGPSGVPTEYTTEGPMVRSVEGTQNPVRYIPENLMFPVFDIPSDWEKLPAVNRTMTFALTVRDKISEIGQVDVDFMKVTANSREPFTVFTPMTWQPGITETVRWHVGQTADKNTINCQKVNIKLSTNYGSSFPINIALGVPNTGEHTFTVPEISSTFGVVILIEAADNIFHSASSPFNITSFPDFSISDIIMNPINCGDTVVEYHFNYKSLNGFNHNVSFDATGIPDGAVVTFSPTNLNLSGEVTMTISNLENITTDTYILNISGITSSETKSIETTLPYFNSICNSSGITENDDTAITLVKLNTIDNASEKMDGYTDYTAVSTNLNLGSSYDLEVQVKVVENSTVSTMVWIDWNQNCKFDDPEESYDLGDTEISSENPATRSITVPENALLGTTVMRVTTKQKTIAGPYHCDTNFDGEVEDYSITVLEKLNPDIGVFSFENFNIIPNPNKGLFNVNFDNTITTNINASIYDIRGRIIFNRYYVIENKSSLKFDLNTIQSGIYILKISEKGRSIKKKMVIY